MKNNRLIHMPQHHNAGTTRYQQKRSLAKLNQGESSNQGAASSNIRKSLGSNDLFSNAEQSDIN